MLGIIYHTVASWRDARRYPPPGRMVQVGEHKLHIHQRGEGSLNVIFESGAGGTSLDWGEVISDLASSMSVVSYDRAGLGWSEVGPLPRTSGRIAEELHTLLRIAKVPPPYILVGHSFGGLNVRLFASKYPKEVVGLVLEDAIHEDFYSKMPSIMKEMRDGQLKQLYMGERLSFSGLPRVLFPPLATQGLGENRQAAANALGYLSSTYATVADEAEAFDESALEIRNADSLPSDMNVVVLSRSRPELWPTAISSQDAEVIWGGLQTELSALTTNTTQIIVENSGHYIHLDQSQIVVDAIQTLGNKVSK